MDNYRVVRFLRWYDKRDDRLVGESLIDNLSLSALQQLLNVTHEDQLVDCYPLHVSQLEQLKSLIPQPTEEIYDYFLECDAV